jgi:hypothetical protein
MGLPQFQHGPKSAVVRARCRGVGVPGLIKKELAELSAWTEHAIFRPFEWGRVFGFRERIGVEGGGAIQVGHEP